MPITTDINNANPKLQAIARVRKIIGVAHEVFYDDDIATYLFLSDAPENQAVSQNIVKLSAALALDTLGTSSAHIQKVTKTLELETDGKSLAAAFQAHAAALRKEVASHKLLAKQEAQEAAASAPPRGQSINGRRVDANSVRSGCYSSRGRRSRCSEHGG